MEMALLIVRCCPNDAAKTDAGICGCGVSDADNDGDGTADCTTQAPTTTQALRPQLRLLPRLRLPQPQPKLPPQLKRQQRLGPTTTRHPQRLRLLQQLGANDRAPTTTRLNDNSSSYNNPSANNNQAPTTTTSAPTTTTQAPTTTHSHKLRLPHDNDIDTRTVLERCLSAGQIVHVLSGYNLHIIVDTHDIDFNFF